LATASKKKKRKREEAAITFFQLMKKKGGGKKTIFPAIFQWPGERVCRGTTKKSCMNVQKTNTCRRKEGEEKKKGREKMVSATRCSNRTLGKKRGTLRSGERKGKKKKKKGGLSSARFAVLQKRKRRENALCA